MKRFTRFAHLIVLAAFITLFAGETFHAHAQAIDNAACGVCQTLHHTPLLTPGAAAVTAAPYWIESRARQAAPRAAAAVVVGAQAIRGPPAL